MEAQLHVPAGHLPAKQYPAALLQQPESRGERLRADGVEHQFSAMAVGELAHGLLDVVVMVVQDQIGRQLLQLSAFRVVAHGRDHPSAEMSGELHGERAQAAGATPDERRLARPQASHAHQRVIGRQAGHGQRRGRLEREIIRERNQALDGNADVLGVAAVSVQSEVLPVLAERPTILETQRAVAAGHQRPRHDAVAFREVGDIRGPVDNGAGDVGARNVREVERDPRIAAAHEEINSIQACGPHFDDHLAGFRLRIRHIRSILENVGISMTIDDDRTHSAPLYPMTTRRSRSWLDESGESGYHSIDLS